MTLFTRIMFILLTIYLQSSGSKGLKRREIVWEIWICMWCVLQTRIETKLNKKLWKTECFWRCMWYFHLCTNLVNIRHQSYKFKFPMQFWLFDTLTIPGGCISSGVQIWYNTIWKSEKNLVQHFHCAIVNCVHSTTTIDVFLREKDSSNMQSSVENQSID